MTIKEILSTTEHRPWPLPMSSWRFYQEWNKAIFMHWEVNYEELRKLVPKELEIDLMDGKPWASLVAFTMENIRPKNLPAILPIPTFEEINIRTYVKSNNKTGVYFLSIEASNKLSCFVAKAISELPYRFSKMARDISSFTSSNAEFGDNFQVNFQVEEEQPKKTQLDKWLTERYALFQETKRGINKFEIHHVEWPIRNININNLHYEYARFNNLLIGKPHKIQYSEGVKVVAWGKEKLATI